MTMVSKLCRVLAVCAGAMVLTGCIVQSFYPFYLPARVQDLAALQGDWVVAEDMGDKAVPGQRAAWTIKDNLVTAVDKDNRSAVLEITLFKVGGADYADVFPGDGNRMNQYLAFHFAPAHTLCKVVRSGARLTFIPMDPRRVEDLVAQHRADLKFVKDAGTGVVLYISPAEDWQRFLAVFGNEPGLFDAKNEIVLERAKGAGV